MSIKTSRSPSELTPATVKALNDLLCSIFVPFEGADMIIDLDDPNSIFQLTRLVCQISDSSKLTCRSRWQANMCCGLGEQSMLVAMCGATIPEDGSGSRYAPACQFCYCPVLSPSAKSCPNQGIDLTSLIEDHTINCPYRWFLTHQRSPKNSKDRTLSYDNAAMVSHLQKMMKKMSAAQQFGFSGDVICTALAQRYLTMDKYHDDLELAGNDSFIDIDLLMGILTQFDAQTVPGIATHLASFMEEENSIPEYRVWPRIRARYQRPNYHLRQVILLPRLKEEIEVAE